MMHQTNTATMESEPADPLARGVLATARQSFRDLFVWKRRVVISNNNPANDDNETHCVWEPLDRPANPLSLLGALGFRGWVFFLVGFAAWTADAFDFHALSIQTVKLSKHYGRSKADISAAITLTLLLRSVGAAIFGAAGDRWGRKWPMVADLSILGLVQIATIYCKTFGQFLAVRALFGLFMGGAYGNAIAMALEHCPNKSRGIMSGILQQGYSFGYVLAACGNLSIGGDTESWPKLFWAGAGLSFGVALVRMFFPESQQFLDAKALGKKSSARAFWRDTKAMFKHEWRMAIYCIILMTWFNYYSHTSQDSYTTFMIEQKQLNNSQASRASILMKTGACVGGAIIGYSCQFLGRRRTIIGAALISGLLVPAWILPRGERNLSASGFFMQFFVQGAWGVVPIHLNELSPPAYRSLFPGVTYQIGNMISSPSAQIVNAVAESHTVTVPDGSKVDAYGPTMGVATAIIAIGLIVTAALGPERCGRDFENAVAGLQNEEPPKYEGSDEEKSAGNIVEKTSS